eukprot:7484003-Lingulodinium_polyedra.AAC.1
MQDTPPQWLLKRLEPMPCCPQICDGRFYLKVGGRADKTLEHPPCLHAVLDHSGWRCSTLGEHEKNILE